MTIASVDDYISAKKQIVPLTKTAAVTSVAAAWFSMFATAGQPGAGVLSGGETTPPANNLGRVPTDAIPGYPAINAFDPGAIGYLSRLEFADTVAARIALYDRLWVGGPYAFNANVAVTMPSIASRVPGGDYNGLEIWVETVTAPTGNQAVNVTYTDQDGNTGAVTGAVGIGAAPTSGRCWQLPLAAGDNGVQAISSIAGSVASAGTTSFNVMLLRPLWQGRVAGANQGDLHDMLRLGLPRVYEDSALYMLVSADSTSTGMPDLTLEIANK